jgi:hypothetical protein
MLRRASEVKRISNPLQSVCSFCQWKAPIIGTCVARVYKKVEGVMRATEELVQDAAICLPCMGEVGKIAGQAELQRSYNA